MFNSKINFLTITINILKSESALFRNLLKIKK